MLRIGSDIGGTFTDITVVDDDSGEVTHKKLLTSAQPADAIIQALGEMGVDLGETSFFSHGTTIAINVIIQGTGARTGLVMTRGFRDTLELRRGARTHILDPLMDKPKLFVPRRWRAEVGERVRADGTVERPLDAEELCTVVQRLVDQGVEALAICFMHSYAYPDHERQARSILAERFPGLAVTLSSEIVPEIKEFERTSTAVLNAYCQPVVKQYLEALQGEARRRGLPADVHLMQSNGGLILAPEAARQPIRILESGPASGSIAAARMGARIGIDNLITFDMGGTTAKSSVVEAGEPLMTVEYELFEEHDKPGSGWPIRVPMIDIVEIGAGGGSIAWLDEAGRLQVGPRSAGSEPGPVCYGRGGVEPTISDAHAVLGNLKDLLGGAFPLDRAAARAAVARVAQPLGLTVEDAAAGILKIASAKVADLIREVTVSRGRDPRLFALVAYGGNGGLEAASILSQLDMPVAVIPPTPGTFSAFGLLDADLVTHTARTFLVPLADADPRSIATLCDEMAAPLHASMVRQGMKADQVRIDFHAELRYRGQFHQVPVAINDVRGGDAMMKALAESFHQEHLRLFTYELRDEPIEIVNLRARATGTVRRPELRARKPNARGKARADSRPVRFRDASVAVECAIQERTSLAAGAIVEGPAIIEEYTSATLVPPGFRAEVDAMGNILLRKDA